MMITAPLHGAYGYQAKSPSAFSIKTNPKAKKGKHPRAGTQNPKAGTQSTTSNQPPRCHVSIVLSGIPTSTRSTRSTRPLNFLRKKEV
jgi:hypothetical protein